MALDEEKKLNKTDYENDWALDTKDNPIHIAKASSGAQGYYCLGCGEEMQAYKSDIRKSFFRHDAKNINKEKVECVIASKIYRERLAETILNRLKFVKVPTLYKYPPKGIEGTPMFLQKSKTITASYTKAQEWFYEDENGNIKNGKNPDIEERYLLIRPDVTFFDENKNPVLFIEFVITHKLTTEKKVKLNRLGINTVQIIIPKVPEEEIEKALKSSRKYKWVYNEIEANTTYISVPKENSEEIPSIDEEQRKLFEESFQCRTAQINQLVRDIKKCIRSESYQRVKRLFESEISRVAQNRKRAQQRLVELEEQYRAEALERNRGVENRVRKDQNEFEQNYRAKEKELRSDIETAEQGLADMEESNRRAALDRNRGEEEKVESKYADLEERYLDKDRKLEQGVRDYIRAQDIGIPIKLDIERAERMVWELQRDTNEAEEQIRERYTGKFKNIDSKIKQLDSEQENLDETVRAEIDSKINAAESSIKNIERQQEGIENEIWNEFRTEIEFEDSEIKRLEEEEKEFEREVREEFYRELKESPGKLPRAIKTILDAKRVGSTFSESKRIEARYKKAREIFKKGTWKRG